MFFTRPSSTSASIARHVSSRGTASTSSAEVASVTSGRKDTGKWMRKRSKWERRSCARDSCTPFFTNSGRWKLFHSLEVMKMSSRLTAPLAIFSSSARPTSSSLE